MAHKTKEMKILATPEKGEVSALLIRPADASHMLVLGHGASTNMRHSTLQTVAERMAEAGIATFRYNFPYMEHGAGRDSQGVCTATVRSAVAAAHKAAPDLRLLAGGHSFGALHQPGKPDTKRADHLSAVTVPMLFLSGTRDEMANLDLLQPVCKKLGKHATLHLLDTADHGFRILKRSRKSDEDVFVEMARVLKEWAGSWRLVK